MRSEMRGGRAFRELVESWERKVTKLIGQFLHGAGWSEAFAQHARKTRAPMSGLTCCWESLIKRQISIMTLHRRFDDADKRQARGWKMSH